MKFTSTLKTTCITLIAAFSMLTVATDASAAKVVVKKTHPPKVVHTAVVKTPPKHNVKIVTKKPPVYKTVKTHGNKVYYTRGVYYRPTVVNHKKVYVVTPPAPGTIVNVVPRNPVRRIVNGITYIIDGASCLIERKEGEKVVYVVQHPPVGLVFDQLPEYADSVVVGTTTYYYAHGTFYLPIENAGQLRYITVESPVGAEVAYLPEHAAPIVVDTTTYYLVHQTYYLLQQVHGEIRYIVTPNPTR